MAEEKKNLDEAKAKKSKLLKDAQDFIEASDQSQTSNVEASGSDANEQLMEDVANLTTQVKEMQTSLQRALDEQAILMQASMQTVVNNAVQQLFQGPNPASGGSITSGGSSVPVPASTSNQSAGELFWLQGQVKNKVILLTEKLLKGPLDDPQDQKRLAKLTVDKLINDWQKAMDAFVGQTGTILTNGDPQEIAMALSALFFIHKQLQTLYNNLNATVIQQPEIIQL